MANDYNFKEIEKKWQNRWEIEEYGKSEDFSDKPKFYSLIEFPYPSGAGLHVGHCMMYSATDAHARMMRMKGFNVMFPMGWDAFGLPTENFAIKNKIKPQDATAKNVETFVRQQKSLGYSFDWSREINTTDPEYYRWTQWIFLQFYKHAYNPHQLPLGKGESKRGLIEVADDDTTTPRMAYQAKMPVNWCPSCRIILANEEVINGKCERCGTQAEKRVQKQWMLRITAYADKLIEGLENVDYEEKIKTQQINWIGRSEGIIINFDIITSSNSEIPSAAVRGDGISRQARDDKNVISVFTTRADTLFGCTYVVLSPEHPAINNLKFSIFNFQEVEDYVVQARKKSDLERAELQKEKTGVRLDGVKAINPINGREVDIYVADYVLASYGTGAVMAVPAHDERDLEFARKYKIEIIPTVIKSSGNYRSYLMGAEKISDKELTNLGISIIHKENSDSRKLEIPKNSIGQYEAIIKEKLENGFWNEYVGEKIVFIFKHKSGDIEKLEYSEQNKQRINQLCAEFTNDTSGKTIIEDWLNDGADGFYHDYLLSTEYGRLIDSNEFSGLTSEEAKQKITEKLKTEGFGDFTVNYKLRDWIFSRQHYWGEPIPIVHCDKCGPLPLEEDQLPLTLPDVEKYEPTDTGESPLAAISEWVNTTCPKCGGSAKRETDTMPNWAGSSWYYLAYALAQKLKDESRKGNLFYENKDLLNYWMQVDLYNGGNEHITLHLLYSRFWNIFLHDLGVVPYSEPYAKRMNHGIILGPDGQKMSKSKGNVINPDEMAAQYGADSLRTYIMFIGPYNQDSAWSMAGIQGVFRFMKRVWANQDRLSDQPDEKELLVKLNQTIQGISKDLESFQMNTVVSKLMELNNAIEKAGSISRDSYVKFLKLLFVTAPHIASELWENAAIEGKIEYSSWPEADPKYLVADIIEVVVQVNGKVREKLRVSPALTEEELKSLALRSDKVLTHIEGKEIIKTIVIPQKLISIVVK